MFCQIIAQKRNKKSKIEGTKLSQETCSQWKTKYRLSHCRETQEINIYMCVCVFVFLSLLFISFHFLFVVFIPFMSFQFFSFLFITFHVFSFLFISFHYFSCLFISVHFFSLIFCIFLLLKKPLPIQTTCTSTHLVLLTWFSPRQSTSPGHRRIDHRAAVLPWKGCFFTTPLCSRLTWSLAMSSAPHWREQSNDPLNHNSCRSRLNVDCREMSVGPRLWMHAFRISQQSQRISKRLSKRISKRLSKATLWGFSRPKQIEAIWNRQCRWALQTPSAHPPTILEAGG